MKAGLVLLAIASATAAHADPLESFFGPYRAKSFNGLANIYSDRFFYPSIDAETSIENRLPDGSALQTLNLNFEVPVKDDAGQVSLKFLFAEAFLDAGTRTEIPGGIELDFDGPIQRRIGEQWVACNVHRITALKHLDATHIAIYHREETAAPCVGEDDTILAERVAGLSSR